MAKFVLQNNVFEFDSQLYQQISGTAIGTKFAPPYACLYMDYIEKEFLKTQSVKPWLWKRFIDDIFFIWADTEESLKTFLKDLNSFKRNLKFTYEKSRKKINFLDVVIRITNGVMTTDLYSKPTDGHQYLHYESCHAEHIKRSIIFSQTLRLRRICTEKKDLLRNVEELKQWFGRRGYPSNLIKSQVSRALEDKSSLNVDNSKNDKKVGVPLVVTFHPTIQNISDIIKQNLVFLFADETVKKVFTPSPFVSFRSTRNLKSFLVRSKIYPLEREVGSKKCEGNRCQVCINVKETKTFESFQTNKQFKINHELDCNSKCLIYLLSCKTCCMQYVGSTTDKFRFRWNNYKLNSRKAEKGEDHMQTYVFEHFSSEGHNGFLEDCEITFIDKTDNSDPVRREEYWRRMLKTSSPYGLNTLD